jgi:DNA-directed RNA polymerase sigma subunit (sigma70/sigma32)
MSKSALSEEKNAYPEGMPEDVLEELADELADEDEEEEEPSPTEVAEAVEEVGGADLVDTYLKSVGRFPMLKIEEEQEYVRILEAGKA